MQQSYLPGELIREIRKRKGLRQSHIQNLANGTSDSQVTLSRIENLRQDPSKSTLNDLLSKVDMPYEQFFCPYMEDQPAESFVLRHQIAYLLDRADGDTRSQTLAREMLGELRGKLSFESLINKQLWISLKARLDIIEGIADEETLRLILEGLRLTYPEFDELSFDGEVLIFYECDLLLELARCRARLGDSGRAAAILNRVLDGYGKLPVAEQWKDPMLCKVSNALTDILLSDGDYEAALDASEKAVNASKKDADQSQLALSIYLRAQALFHSKKDMEKSNSLLRQAYFAFSLLQMEAMQKQSLKDVWDFFGEGFDTHNVENTLFELPDDLHDLEYGSSLHVDELGKLLKQFRLAAGLKPVEVYKGICSRSFYSRLESGERKVISYFLLEALFERLGRDPDLYLSYFSSLAEFKEDNLRKRFRHQSYIGNASNAEAALKELMEMADYSEGLRLQWLLFSKAIMKYEKGEFDDALASILNDAIRVTIPDFSEDRIHSYRLTRLESNIINAIAYVHIVAERQAHGVGIFKQIRESMCNSYVDESIKTKYYATIVLNLAVDLNLMKQHEEALAYADECERISRRHGVLHRLNDIADVKAKILFNLGRKEEAIAYAAMAYYSGHLTVREDELAELISFVEESLGLTFSRDLGFVFYKEKDV